MPKAVLIVDDVKINRQLLHRIIIDDYTVFEAENGEEALKILFQQDQQISAVLLDLKMPVMDGFAVLQTMAENPLLSQIPVIVTTGDTDVETEARALDMGATDFVTKPFDANIIKRRIKNLIALRETSAMINTYQKDKLTGLWNRDTFLEKAGRAIENHEPGYYYLSAIDIDNFKVINDQYGMEKGDEVLKSLAKVLLDDCEITGGLCGRISADNFVVLFPCVSENSDDEVRRHREAMMLEGLPMPVTLSMGRYLVADKSISVSAMYDRAKMARDSVKGRFDTHIALYDESMRAKLVQEQEIINEMNNALITGQFEAWFQPQYNHATGALIGAEALARWRHPVHGMVSPAEFIPVFERNGFVYELDKCIWEQVCARLRKWLDQGHNPLPVSVNISRYDLFRKDLVPTVIALTEKYGISPDLLRLEITESAFAESSVAVVNVVKQFINHDFTVEIDDFGSGYSSLNTLKDVPAQILKLDMKFLDSSVCTLDGSCSVSASRGGNILESIVRMAKWLGMSVIAEGVEKVAQADYLRSIGCNYIQGYLYARPLPLHEYEALIGNADKEERLIKLETVENLDNNSFWEPESMDTLMFNSYVGAACIFEFQNDRIELVRSSKKFAEMIGGDAMTIADTLKLDWSAHLDEENRRAVAETIERSRTTKEEATAEFVFNDLPGCPEKTYIRATFRVIATAGERCLIYNIVENTTARREAEKRERAVATQMQAIMENINGGVSAATLDDAGNIHYVFTNEKYYRLYGYTKEQFETELPDAFHVVIPEDRTYVMSSIAELVHTERPTMYQYRCRKRDGDIIHLRVYSSIVHLEGIDAPVILAVASDVTEIVNAEQKLYNADEQLRFLNEIANDLLAQSEIEVGINEVLQKILVYFNADRAYIIEQNDKGRVSDNTYEICRPGVRSEISNLQGIPISTYSYWITAFENGDYINIEDISAMPANRRAEQKMLRAQNIQSLISVPFHRDGKLLGFIGLDNPSRRQDQAEQLRALGDYLGVMLTRRDLTKKIESDSKTLQAFMDDTPGGFARMRLLPNGMLSTVYVNEPFCRLRKMTKEEILQADKENALAAIHPDDKEQALAAIEQIMATGGEGNLTYRLLCADGSYLPLNAHGRITQNEVGDTFVNIFYTELSDEEKQNYSIGETMPFILSAIMESSNDYAFAKDKDYRYICCSPAFLQVANVKSESDVIGKTDFDLFPQKMAEQFYRNDISLFAAGKPMVDFEESFCTADGMQHYCLASKHILRNSAGGFLGLYGVSRDITTERNTYAQLKLLTDSIPGGLASYAITPTGMKLTYYNAGFCELLGSNREEYEKLEKEAVMDLIFPEDLPELKQHITAILAGEDTIDCTYRSRRIDGNGYVWINQLGTVAERHEDTVYVNMVLYDVTAVKLGEEALRIHEEELKIAMSQMGKMICEYDIDSKTLTLPTALAARYGAAAVVANVPETIMRGSFIDKEYLPVYADFYDAIFRGEESGTMEYHGQWKNGVGHWLRMDFSTIFDSIGKPIKAVISVEDTTEQHDGVKQAAMERERMYIALANLIPMAVSVNLTQNSYHMISYNAYTREPAPEQGVYDDLVAIGLGTVPEVDRRVFENAFARENLLAAFAEGREKVELEHRQINGAGEELWMLTQVFRVDNPYDSDVLEVTVARDVTEEKESRALLQKTYDMTIENMPDFTAKWLFKEGDVLLLHANQKYLDFMGITAEAAYGKSIIYGFAEEEKTKLIDALYRAEKKRENISLTCHAVKTKGGECWLSINASFFEEQDGCSVYLGALSDVTELVMAKEELRISKEEYKLAAALSSRTVLRCDVRSRKFSVLSPGDEGQRFAALDGREPEALVSIFPLLPESLIAYRQLVADIEQGVPGKRIQLGSVGADGQTHWAELDYHTIFDMEGHPATAIISVENITEQRKKEAVYKRWQQSIAEKSPEDYTLFRWNISRDKATDAAEGKLIALTLNPTQTKTLNESMLEYADAHVYLEDRRDYLGLLNSDMLLASYHRGIRVKTLEYREKCGEESVRWLHLTVELVEYANSTDVEAYMLFENIDARKREELLIREKAELDPLTGVLNRATFALKANDLKSKAAAGFCCALLILDVDRFKLLNDTFGHAAGDEALIYIADTLRGVLRPCDLLGRLGGDEFLIGLQDMSSDADIEKKAEQICAALRKSYSDDVRLSVSIGIAVCPRDGVDFDSVYHKADAALYAVKNAGKDGYAFYYQE